MRHLTLQSLQANRDYHKNRTIIEKPIDEQKY